MIKFNDLFVIKSATMNLTNNCNLKCSYCFEKGKNSDSMSMSDGIEIFKRLYANFSLFKSSPTEKLSINFFGGEPFLNYTTMEAIINYTYENFISDVDFGVTTNLTILDEEKLEFIKKHNLFLLVSFDGLPETHNLNRDNSHDIVAENIKKVIDYGLNHLLQVRMTVHPNSINLFMKNVEYIVDILKVDNLIPVIVSDAEWSEEAKKEMTKQYDELFHFFMIFTSNGDKYRNVFIKPVEEAIARCFLYYDKFATPCGFGNNSWVSVGVEGDLYPCHQRHTMPEFRNELLLGNILTDKVFNNKLEGSMSDWISFDDCTTCSAYNICIGWCPSESISTYGNAFTIPPIVCFYNRLMVDLAIKYSNFIMEHQNLRSPLLNRVRFNYTLLSEFLLLQKVNVFDVNFGIKFSSFYDNMVHNKDEILPSFFSFFCDQIDMLTLFLTKEAETIIYNSSKIKRWGKRQRIWKRGNSK